MSVVCILEGNIILLTPRTRLGLGVRISAHAREHQKQIRAPRRYTLQADCFWEQPAAMQSQPSFPDSGCHGPLPPPPVTTPTPARRYSGSRYRTQPRATDSNSKPTPPPKPPCCITAGAGRRQSAHNTADCPLPLPHGESPSAPTISG